MYGVAVEAVQGSTAVAIKHVAFDSRQVAQGTLFVAQRGLQVDGHRFIQMAIKHGAAAVVCEEFPREFEEGITYVKVEESSAALAIIASNFYGNPSEKLNLTGVTGTNGKTTIATLLYQQFKNAGYKTGLLSTIKVMVDEREFPATHTTPDSLQINRFLKDMVDAGVTHCFMEVSSHGIDQKRTKGLRFKGGVFTNLTHDHLDYHRTFAAYRDTKKRFFDELPKTAFALVNADDKNGAVMLQNTAAKKYTYALKTMADYTARIVENQFDGLVLNIDNQEVYTKLVGAFNAYNLLAVYAVADLLGMDKLENLRIISSLETVNGRFQYLRTADNITAVVDYAHTPDALKNVLDTINTIRTHNEKVITVVGCGGDRDKEKRPKMGHIASVLSNRVIFTSDNPRTEDPVKIIEDIEKGVPVEHMRKTISIVDRKQAIKTACNLADSGDIILIAGKGHETYQVIGTEKTDFDDYRIVNEFLKELKK